MTYRLMHAVMCPVMKLFGLSCRQFAGLAALRMDRPLGRLESARFHFHRTMCGLCRRLPAQLENLRILTRCVCRPDRENEAPATSAGGELSPEARERIRQALCKEGPREPS